MELTIYTDNPRARATESVLYDPELNLPDWRHKVPHPSRMSLKEACRSNEEVLTIFPAWPESCRCRHRGAVLSRIYILLTKAVAWPMRTCGQIESNVNVL